VVKRSDSLLPYIHLEEEEKITKINHFDDFVQSVINLENIVQKNMKSTNNIKLESILLPYDSFWCSVLMIICSPWYCLFIKMIYRISKLDNIREKALIMNTYKPVLFYIFIQDRGEKK
jgi:hypothetical protein